MLSPRNWVVALAAALPLLAAGCGRSGFDLQAHEQSVAGSAASSPAAAAHMAKQMAAGREADNSGGSTADDTAKSGATLATVADSEPDRYLIRNATITIEAKDVGRATSLLVQAVQGIHGYVADLKDTADDLGIHSTTVTVRVPFSGFDRSMQDLAALGKVLDKQVTAEDVTEEYVDTRARVRNLRETELRLLDHLRRTGRLADTLLVEKELTRVREEIEQSEGRIRFLSHRIAFSTIAVTLRQKAAPAPLLPAQSYSAAKEGADAARSLLGFAEELLTYVIWIAVWLPVWGMFVVGCVIGYRAYRRRQRIARPAPALPIYLGPQPVAVTTDGVPTAGRAREK